MRGGHPVAPSLSPAQPTGSLHPDTETQTQPSHGPRQAWAWHKAPLGLDPPAALRDVCIRETRVTHVPPRPPPRGRELPKPEAAPTQPRAGQGGQGGAAPRSLAGPRLTAALSASRSRSRSFSFSFSRSRSSRAFCSASRLAFSTASSLFLASLDPARGMKYRSARAHEL